MNNTNKLTLEQEFKLAIYKNQLKQLDENNLRKYLVNTLKNMMTKDNVIKYCIKKLIN
uniref:Uncharacterized protein ycf18 n=1 Tax=Chondria sp. (in: red algae) TaxID=1982705 RepID=A0A1Z1MDT2_9FLOR|nr:phycobilisome degradation protein [Chondria sp. (in: red algae)]